MPITEEQRQNLLKLQNKSSSFDTGLDTTFDVNAPEVAPMQEELPPIIPAQTQPTEIAPIVDESPLVEDVPAVQPAEGGAGVDPLLGGTVASEPAIAPIEPVTAPEVAPTAPGIGFPGLQQQAEDVFGQQAEAVTQLSQIEAEEAEAKTPLLEERSKILEDYNVNTKKIMDKATEDVKSGLADISRQTKEFEDMKYTGYWQSKGAGEKILGALSIALGAYAQGLSGGRTPNTALSIINKEMDNDFKQFQAKSNKKIQLIQQSRASLATKQDATRQEMARQEAYKLGQLSQLENKLGEITNKFKSPKAKEQANILLSQIGQAKLNYQTNLQGQIEAKAARDAQVALDKQKVNLSSAANLLKKQELQQKAMDKKYVPGVGVALTEADAKDVKDISIAKEEFDDKLSELIALREEKGGEVLDREAVARGKQLSKQLLLKYKEMAKLGVLSQSDMDIVESIIPADPLQFELVPGQDPTMENLRALKEDLQKKYDVTIKTRIKTPEPTKQTKVVNGISYQKVPGGWKRVQ